MNAAIYIVAQNRLEKKHKNTHAHRSGRSECAVGRKTKSVAHAGKCIVTRTFIVQFGGGGVACRRDVYAFDFRRVQVLEKMLIDLCEGTTMRTIVVSSQTRPNAKPYTGCSPLK